MHAEIIEQKSDQNLGGRNLDYQLMEKISKTFYEENNEELDEEPINNKKSRLSMLAAIEKARITLSGDTETTINIDCLGNDISLISQLTRDEFEDII